MPGSRQAGRSVGASGAAAQDASDRRVVRTRNALLQAFIALVLEKRYSSIKVADIADCADVGRSTFYEHFASKDAMLLESMGWMFAILADAVRPECPRAPLDGLVEHFWANRGLARAVLEPPIERKLRRALAGAIEQRLAASADPVARKIASIRIAAGQLGMLEAWTRGELSARTDQVGDALLSAARQ
jgi:AcrR family transcriptional regulator